MHTIKRPLRPLGSIMIDISGPQLTQKDRERLAHPHVAGVILFARHYESPQQLEALCHEIHEIRHPKLLIGVDHEGGRVQRFREGFTRLPSMRPLGKLYDENPQDALKMAEQIGWVMATELLAAGVDFSFAPVLDLDYGDSRVIGDRSFHSDPKIVSMLSGQLVQGMREAGMASVAKHFPGHGFIQADTHLEEAVDERSLDTLIKSDIQPFLSLIEHNIEAIMPAHVRYPKIDSEPAGFSRIWLQDILRKKCGFQGAIISDDLSMQAAKEHGNPLQRVTKALQAGCDLVLMCNDLESVDAVLDGLVWEEQPLSHARLIRLHGHAKVSLSNLQKNPIWQARSAQVNAFVQTSNQQVFTL